MRNCLAESDSNRCSPKRQPISFRVEPIASENYARHDRNARHVREGRCSSAQRRAFEQRLGAIANAAFRKNADNSAVFQPFDGALDRLAIGPIACSWKRIHRPQKMSEPWNREKLG